MSGHSWFYWAPAAASGPSHDSRSIHHKSGNGSSATAQKKRQGEKDTWGVQGTNYRRRVRERGWQSQREKGKREDKNTDEKSGKKRKKRRQKQTTQRTWIIAFTVGMYSSPQPPLHHVYSMLSSVLQPYDQQLSTKAVFKTFIFHCLWKTAVGPDHTAFKSLTTKSLQQK